MTLPASPAVARMLDLVRPRAYADRLTATMSLLLALVSADFREQLAARIDEQIDQWEIAGSFNTDGTPDVSSSRGRSICSPAGRTGQPPRDSTRQDARNCIACRIKRPGKIHRPMYEGLSSPLYNPPEATWEYVDRLKKLTRMKVLLKGLDSAEDARLAVEHGAAVGSSLA